MGRANMTSFSTLQSAHIGIFYPAFWRWLRHFSRVTFPDLPSKFLHALFEPWAGGLMLCQLSPRVLRSRPQTPSASLAVWYLGAAASDRQPRKGSQFRVLGRECNFSKAAEKPFPP